MPRTREVNALIKDERKSAIVSAASFLFAIYGDNVSVDQICERAKCSHGLLYHYFLDVHHVYRTILNSTEYTTLAERVLETKSSRAIDKIFDIINNFSSAIKKKDISMLCLLAILNREDLFIALKKLAAEGQKEGTVNDGKPEEISSIYKNQNIGVLTEILLQKPNKIVIPSSTNLIAIFHKKTIR